MRKSKADRIRDIVEKLQWNVLYHSINKRTVMSLNIFKHSGFVNDICKISENCDSKNYFEEEICKSLQYYYWCKAEWEVLIYPWCGGSDDNGIKIDVFTQIVLNWTQFIEYLWNALKEEIKEETT